MNKFCFQLFTFLFALVVSLHIDAANLYAQPKVKADEDVRVYYLNGWHDGVVVDTKGKQVMVEFIWANSLQQKVFNRNQVRRMNEVNAIDFGRTWKSASGKFEVSAALKTVKEDKVVLIKDDLEEIEVALSVLSTSDQGYVTRMMKKRKDAVRRGQVPAYVPELPDIEDFGFGSAFSMFAAGSNAQSLSPFGALPSFLKFSQKGVGFRMSRQHQRMTAVIPVGGPDELVLVGARENNFHNRGNEFQSQLYWLSMKKQKVVGFASITPEDYTLDYDPKTKLLLSYHDSGHRDEVQSNYTIWKLMPGEEKVEPVIRFSADQVGSPLRGYFGKIINERIILAQTDRHQYEAWDVVDKKALYSVKAQSFFDVPAILTPDRSTLILAEDEQLTLINTVTGEVRSSIQLEKHRLTGANINAAGTKLVAITRNNVLVWDLTTGIEKPKVYKAESVGGAFKARVDWIDDDHVLIEGFHNRVLYRLSLGLPIWSYKMDVSDSFLNDDPLLNLCVGGKFFYVAEPEGPFSSAVAVGVVSMPGPKVDEVTQEIDSSTLNLLKAGVRVGVTVDANERADEIQNWLSEKVESNNWLLDDNAEIQLVATMGLGETQNVEYETFGQGGGVEKVSFRPHYSRLRLMLGKTVIWQSGTSTGAPPFISGGNAQAKVNQLQKPNFAFFENVVIPNEIMDPKYSHGFGVSKLGLRGIQVISTSPPGREADPEAAAQEAARQRQEEASQPPANPNEQQQQGGNQGNGAGSPFGGGGGSFTPFGGGG